MTIDYNSSFDQYHRALSKEPRWTVAIDFSGSGDIHYFTSHSTNPVPSASVIHSCLLVTSLASQTLAPNDGRATIGRMGFDLIDLNSQVTDLLRTKLEAGDGIRKTKVAMYKGYAGMTGFSEYELMGTQIIDGDFEYNRQAGKYAVRCLDSQHLLKKKIFVLARTNITATLTEDGTTLNVRTTNGFNMFSHDDAYDDAPSSVVGYLKIKQSDDKFEIVRYSGLTDTSFTGLVRAGTHGLGGEPLTHEWLADTEADQQIEVEEFVYLEGPVMKIAYAMLTGELYGQSGLTIPSNWHLGIDPSYINLSSFTSVGGDIWTPSINSSGYQCRFTGVENEDGKAFFEKELMLLAASFHYVNVLGQVSVRRMANASPNAACAGYLTESNIVSVSGMTHELASVANIYRISWNWEPRLERFTRINVFVDGNSINTHDIGAQKTYEFKGMYGNRMTVDRLQQRLDALRSMYAGPPLRISVTCHSRTDQFEVGDTVGVSLDTVRDFTNGGTTTLNRAFMVFGKSVNVRNGEVTYQLFGSSQEATTEPVPGVGVSGNVVPDATYTGNPATSIEAIATAAGAWSVVGGIGVVTGDITLTGVAGDINDPLSIFWYDGDLEISPGVTVTINNGVQIWAKGFFENKGVIDGQGRGRPATDGYQTIPVLEPIELVQGLPGEAGFIGITRASGGFISSDSPDGGGNRNFLALAPALHVFGQNTFLPSLSVEYVPGGIAGLPDDLRGTSGGRGGKVKEGGVYYAGGAGGASGAPLVIVCRGGSTSSGVINTSGADGQPGTVTPGGGYAGAGGGGAGSPVIVIIDGPANTFTGELNITTNRGDSLQGGTFPQGPNFSFFGTSYFGNSPANWGLPGESGTRYYAQLPIAGEQIPQVDPEDLAPRDSAPTLTEYITTPVTAKGDLSTIEIVANDTGGSNYKHSIAYYREQGTEAWTQIPQPANPTTTQVVVADGKTYEFQTRSVSTANVESASGPVATITVSDIYSYLVADPNGVYSPFVPPITGLELFEQGNSTEFSGRDAKFAWRQTSVELWYEIGSEPQSQGAGAGGLDLYWRDYEINLYTQDGVLLRTEHVTDNWYSYTSEKNAEDYFRLNQTTGRHRRFQIQVANRSLQGKLGNFAKLTVENPAPDLPTGVLVLENFQALDFSYTPPTDLDWEGIEIWLDPVSGFTPSDVNKVYDGPDTSVSITGLQSGFTFYLRFRVFDYFGREDGNMSAEYTLTLPAAIDSSEVAGLGNWATRIDAVDLAFIVANMGADAIPSTQIQSIVAGKIAAGTMAAKIALAEVFVASVDGSIMNDDGAGLTPGDWRLDMGPVVDGLTTYILRFHNGAGTKKFSVDTAGNLVASGAITLTSGSTGVANLADAGVLATRDFTTYRQSTIPTGAIAGDMWHNTSTSAVGGIPAGTTARYTGSAWAQTTDATGQAVTTGVNLTAGFLAFNVGGTDVLKVDGTNKKIWINSATYGNSGVQIEYNSGTPRMYMGNGTDTFLKFDGTDLITQTLKTATSGQRIEINPAGDGNIHIYNSSGTEVGEIGIAVAGADTVALSLNASAITGSSAIRAFGDVHGVVCQAYDTGSYSTGGNYGAFINIGSKGTAILAPSPSASAPIHAASKGAEWVTSAGILYINTNGSTAWVIVGTQVTP